MFQYRIYLLREVLGAIVSTKALKFLYVFRYIWTTLSNAEMGIEFLLGASAGGITLDDMEGTDKWE